MEIILEAFTTDMAVAPEIIVRVICSLILGIIIGIERSITHKKIGFRTVSIVCLGSCAFTLVSIYGFGSEADASRVAAQVVTGIGFLGAGAIINTGLTTKGITTAATLWVAAAIGMACGSGMLVLASIVTISSLLLLWAMKPIKRKLDLYIENGNSNNAQNDCANTARKKVIRKKETV